MNSGKGKSGSFYGEMDPTLLPTIIKRGSSIIEDEAKKETKNKTWCQVFSQGKVIGCIIGVIVGRIFNAFLINT